MNLGKAIRIARIRSELKQTELAKKIRVSATYMSLLETNKRTPSWKMLQDICAATSTSLSMLMIEAEYQPALSDQQISLSLLQQKILSLLEEKTPPPPKGETDG